MEEGLHNHSDRIEAIETTCTALLAENERLKNKVEDLESRSRRSNLRVLGIPEHFEGPDTVKFMTVFFFEKVLGKEFFPHPLIISRAHRVGPKPTADTENIPRSLPQLPKQTAHNKEQTRAAVLQGTQGFFFSTRMSARSSVRNKLPLKK